MELPQNNNQPTNHSSNDQPSQQPVQRPPQQPGQFPQQPGMFPQQQGQPGMYPQQPGMQQNQMMNPQQQQMMYQQQQMMLAQQQQRGQQPGMQPGQQQLREQEIVNQQRPGQQSQQQQMNQQQQRYQQEQQQQQVRNYELPPEGYKVPRYPRQELPVSCDENSSLTDSYQRFLYNIGDFCGAGKAILPCCFCVDYPYYQIDQGFVAVNERFGKYVRTEQPGLVYFNPCTDKMYPLDVKVVVVDCNRQFVMTKDNIMCSMDATVYFRIVVPRKTFYYLENIHQSVQQLAQASMKNLAGGRKYQDLQSKREELQREIEEFVTSHVWEWGVEIQQIRIKEILLSPELQEALSMVTKEQRSAEAKIITAQSDVVSAKLMREAADILDSQAAMQIRWLETLSMLGHQNSTKVILIPKEQ